MRSTASTTRACRPRGTPSSTSVTGSSPPDAPDSGLIGLLEPSASTRFVTRRCRLLGSMAIEYRSNNPETEYRVWNDDVVAATDECLAETEAASDDEIQKLFDQLGAMGCTPTRYGDEDLQKALLFGVENAKDYATCMQTHGFGDGETHEGDEASPTLMGRLRGEIELPAREDCGPSTIRDTRQRPGLERVQSPLSRPGSTRMRSAAPAWWPRTSPKSGRSSRTSTPSPQSRSARLSRDGLPSVRTPPSSAGHPTNRSRGRQPRVWGSGAVVIRRAARCAACSCAVWSSSARAART